MTTSEKFSQLFQENLKTVAAEMNSPENIMLSMRATCEKFGIEQNSWNMAHLNNVISEVARRRACEALGL